MAAIEVNNVSKKFKLFHERNQTIKSALMRGRISKHDEFWALQNVSFEIPTGSTFGLIGSNGSGKSTLLKILSRIYTPTSGRITYSGKMSALLEVGSGFHHELSGRENIYLNGSILGMSRKEIDRKFDEIVDFSGVEAFLDQPVKNYSSGMYVRLGFSVAISVQPEILIVDEVLAVGDAEFQEKCLLKFSQLKHDGKTVVLVTHSMASVVEMCDQAAWLEKGVLQTVGPAKQTVKKYLKSIKTA
ncbi:ABC transporter ATP-binding protein [Aurantimicrobium minutum]|uniref:ABC transporter n=1 Tax=Aurantimicrobium minutum TaxID=708131 RepID=A0A173LUW6_9MICO|nr:ABC transporter ATP-binding protein [Aurantimicrobium minutum]BAU98716.1 ABC transporter [Aurantimicrobium minutum]